MESFLVAVNAVIPFFCYLALGYTMKIRGVVKEEFLQKLNQMVFRVFYPFMTFYNIYKADAESLPRPLLLIFTGASILIVEALLIVIIPKIVKENPEEALSSRRFSEATLFCSDCRSRSRYSEIQRHRSRL